MLKKIILSFTVLILLLTSLCIVGYKSYYRHKGDYVLLKIEQGYSGNTVAKLLKEKGIIRHELELKILLKLFHKKYTLKAGSYDLQKRTQALEVLKCIQYGTCIHYEKITILEGWRSEEIAEILAEKEITDPKEFLSIVRNKKLEGYLFPSTYLFVRNTSAKNVVQEMTDQFNKRIAPLFKEYPTDLTINEVLTIASIVEREAVHHEERPKIAAVYLNRFKIGKKLEADPTVQYALGFNFRENRYWKKGLTLKDLRFDSPYNTYRNAGLPPGPICNPSYESVLGVLNPQPNFEAIYFVAEKGGKHVFSKTFKEHISNIKRIRKK